MWMDGVTSGCVHCSVWAEGLLGATGQPIGSRDPRAVRSRWEGDSGAGGIVNVTVTVVTVSAGASDRKVCEANTKASSSAVLVVLSRGIMGMTWTLTLRSVDQMSTRPPPPFARVNLNAATVTARVHWQQPGCHGGTGRSQLGGPGCNSWSHHYLCCGGEGLLSRSIPTATTTDTSLACPTTAFKSRWSNLKG